MKQCFADTSYFLALLIPADEDHARAFEKSVQWHGQVLTSEFIGRVAHPLRSNGWGHDDRAPKRPQFWCTIHANGRLGGTAMIGLTKGFRTTDLHHSIGQHPSQFIGRTDWSPSS